MSKQNSKTHSEPILGGEGELYLMPRSGDVYQLRIWLSQEKKYLRKSLKTTDYITALNRAKDEVLRVMSDTKQGKKQFGVTLGELIQEYLNWRYQDVIGGVITEGRFTTIKSQCRAVLRTKPSDLKVNSLDENSFYDWGQMRRQDNSSITLVTIRNETATIGQIFDFAFRKGYTHFPKMIFRPTKISLDQVGRRGVFTEEEYKKLTLYFKTFVSKKSCPNDDERLERIKVRDFILILANSLLRTGELRQFKWSDVLKYQEDKDESGHSITLVHLRVRKEVSKTRIARDIWVRGGEYFQRVYSYCENRGHDDLIFQNKNGTHQFGTRELYKHWDFLMNEIGIPNYKERKLSYYSLRHFGITYKLKQHTPIADIAYIARTSVSHIEQHYRHVDDEVMMNAARTNKPKSI